MHGYLVHLLPYIEEAAMAHQYVLDPKVRWDAAVNQPVIKLTVPIFLCPSVGEAREAASDYAVPIGMSSDVYEQIRGTPDLSRTSIVLDREFRKLKGIRDGLSKSILMTECAGRPQRYENGKADHAAAPIMGDLITSAPSTG